MLTYLGKKNRLVTTTYKKCQTFYVTNLKKGCYSIVETLKIHT